MSNRRSFLQKAGHVCAGAMAGTAMALAESVPEAAVGQKFLLIGLCGSENPGWERGSH